MHRSYIVASPDDGTALDATFISAGEPMRLILTACVDGAEYVLVGGEGHSLPGRGASAERFARLAAYAAERLGARESTHRWSTQDCVPIDGLPFAGPIAPRRQGRLRDHRTAEVGPVQRHRRRLGRC